MAGELRIRAEILEVADHVEPLVALFAADDFGDDVLGAHYRTHHA